MYYFAYGSNLNHKLMRKRCPSGKFMKKAMLKDHKLVHDGHSSFFGGAVANIIESQGGVVWGALYELSNGGLNDLDFYEGYPKAFERKEMEVIDGDGNAYSAVTYYRKPRYLGRQSDEYRKVILQGAKDCDLPDEYIKGNLM